MVQFSTMSDLQQPFPAFNVHLSPFEEASTDEITDDAFLQYRQKKNRFRVLLVGDERAGKTTLLERVGGNTMDKAQINFQSPDGALVREAENLVQQWKSQIPGRIGAPSRKRQCKCTQDQCHSSLRRSVSLAPP